MPDFEKTAKELIRDYGFDHAFLEGSIRAALSQIHRATLEQAAGVAEHLNGWGSRDGTAEHIAKCIRALTPAKEQTGE